MVTLASAGNNIFAHIFNVSYIRTVWIEKKEQQLAVTICASYVEEGSVLDYPLQRCAL